MNYRCTFPIQIHKNLLNGNSPFILNTEHTTTSIKGQYSFAKEAISPLKTSKLGLTYNPLTGRSNQGIVPAPDNTEGTTS